ncbi:hypothetical protein GCM10010191_38040 [Actinomadura vinacea]|uniref:Uncharacterized protein n=1 Tax=Actinomadura vinacea TaxID=115336 RepID=A0ABN3J5G6_9ACTN
MFHNDIMYTVMQERARDLRAKAKTARDISAYRKSRKFGADEAVEQPEPAPARRGTRTRGAAPAAGR